MTVNVDRAVEIAQDMLKFSDEISKKHLLTQAGIQKAVARLTAGSAQISQLCAALVVLVQKQEVQNGIQSGGTQKGRRNHDASSKKPEGHSAKAGKAGSNDTSG